MNDDPFISLIHSPRVAQPTREVLLSRMERPATPPVPGLVSAPEYEVLAAVLKQMIPQENDGSIDLAALLSVHKQSNVGNGWRYAGMPPDEISLARGLALLDDSARNLFGEDFTAIGVEQQLALLHKAECGELAWQTLDCARWFEELLTDAVEIFVSHPTTMAAMGFDGFAFLPRWQNAGLNATEPWEPRER